MVIVVLIKTGKKKYVNYFINQRFTFKLQVYIKNRNSFYELRFLVLIIFEKTKDVSSIAFVITMVFVIRKICMFRMLYN